MNRQTGLKVMNSARCILYQALHEMFDPNSQFPLILKGRREIEAEFGAYPLAKLRGVFAIAQKKDLSVALLDSRDLAVCRKLAALVAASLDAIASGSCAHNYQEHLDAVFELDNYFGGLVFSAEDKGNALYWMDLELTAWDRDFLRGLKISLSG